MIHVVYVQRAADSVDALLVVGDWNDMRERRDLLILMQLLPAVVLFGASAAEHGDVYLGCNCPTKTNPDVGHCHTTAALRFMKTKYPRLRVRLPK